MLGFPENGLRFFGGQAVVVAEISQNVACFFGLDDETIQPNHSLDGLLPDFGRGPHVGEPPHHAVRITLMTSAALVDRELMVNRNSYGRRILCLGVRGKEHYEQSYQKALDWR